MVTKIQNKSDFKSVLYSEGFDDLVVYDDGSWDNYGDKGKVVIERKHFHDLSQEDVKYLTKLVELVLNDHLDRMSMLDYDYTSSAGRKSREDIQSMWESKVK